METLLNTGEPSILDLDLAPWEVAEELEPAENQVQPPPPEETPEVPTPAPLQTIHFFEQDGAWRYELTDIGRYYETNVDQISVEQFLSEGVAFGPIDEADVEPCRIAFQRDYSQADMGGRVGSTHAAELALRRLFHGNREVPLPCLGVVVSQQDRVAEGRSILIGCVTIPLAIAAIVFVIDRLQRRALARPSPQTQPQPTFVVSEPKPAAPPKDILRRAKKRAQRKREKEAIERGGHHPKIVDPARFVASLDAWLKKMRND